MTTALTRPVTRLVETRRSGILTLKITREGVMFREFGRRRWYGPLDYGKLFQRAVDESVLAEKQRKAALKKAKKK